MDSLEKKSYKLLIEDDLQIVHDKFTLIVNLALLEMT